MSGDVIEAIRDAKVKGKHLTAYCTAATGIEFARWNQKHPVDENTTLGVWPAGTTLKIVMASRFGDVGLTDDLEATYGYHARVLPDGGSIRDIRWDR